MLNRRSFLRWSLSWPLSAPFSRPLPVLHPQDGEATLTTRPTDDESLAHAIVMKHNNVFFVAAPDGTVPLTANHGMGLYYHDCRYLNGYDFTLAGHTPAALSASAAQGSVGVFTLTNPLIQLADGSRLDQEELGITWRRWLDSDRPALLEVLAFQNFTLRTVRFSIALTFRCAFEDVFDVRGLIQQQFGTVHDPQWQHDVLRFFYEGKDRISRALLIRADPKPAERRGTTAVFHIMLAPRGRDEIRLALDIEESTHPRTGEQPPSRSLFAQRESALEAETKRAMHDVTRVWGNGSALDQLMDRSFRGLRVLRADLGGDTYFAAGVPWYVTLFGRDSLVTALQMLAYHPGIAEQTLRLLARYQATRVDESRDEQPGKILHELRVGELARLGLIPHTPSYGTVDATPLFLLVIAQHAAWTGSLTLFHDLRPHIDRALEWLDTYGDPHGTGYLTYDSRTGTGMINKGWKDSDNAVVNADGSLGQEPIALVEVQGYVYAAWRGMSELFARAGQHDRATRLAHRAQQLRERFNHDFWMEDKDCYALALQGQGRQAAVVSSNPGHALWTGIADDDKAQRTVRRLMAPEMFSGWGVRTLSSQERAYNPIGYHLGTVWPHDNAILAAGFRRYGRDEEAVRIFQGLSDAAFHFHAHQLPELFCGFSRDEYEVPIHYPVACHPQAWAAGALPFLVTTLLGLTPEAFDKRLQIVRPLLPPGLDRLDLVQLRVGGAVVDLSFRRERGSIHVDVKNLQGELHVATEMAA